MDTKEFLTLRQRVKQMYPRQLQIINNLLMRIEKCEGTDMPSKYWCPSCMATATRCHALFMRFERMNAIRKPTPKPYQWDSFTKHPGFNGNLRAWYD